LRRIEFTRPKMALLAASVSTSSVSVAAVNPGLRAIILRA
jgi:hypothetical protein